MGKKWDYDVPSQEIWAECLRVLKPGGYLLSFAGTRTQHRMAVRIEDAGFEIRDMIAWVYGSGFPKSLNIGKSVNQLETNEWSKIGKALDNIDQKSIIEVWKSNSNNVKIVETQSLKNQIIAGQDTPSENFAVLNVVQNSNQESSNLLVSFAEQNLKEVQAINTKTNTALPSVEAEIRQLQNNAKSAEQQSQSQNHKSWNIFTAQCNVKEWLNENTEVSLKVDEALKTLRGNKKYSNEEITNVLCAELTDILKLTILNQSNTFQNLDTKSQMDCLSAINVIITVYTAENLISNTVDILKSKAVDKLQGNEREVVGKTQSVQFQEKGYEYKGDKKGNGFANEKYWGFGNDVTKGTSEWEGWGTALKPALEPITVARKPIEGTVANNCLKWGTGGINIDGSRVEFVSDEDKSESTGKNKHAEYKNSVVRNSANNGIYSPDLREPDNYNPQGRFPANFIHDGSDEVVSLFPNTKSGNGVKKKASGRADGIFNINKIDGEYLQGDSGSASRFFYCAKSPKSQRYTYLTCNCETVKLSSWVKQDQNQQEMTETTSPEVDTSEVNMETDYDSNTTSSGKKQMDQFQKDTLSTTLTGISSTTISQTSKSLLQQNTSESTLGANSEGMNGGSHAESVENSNQSIQTTGTSQERAGRSMGVAVPATLAESYKTSVCVDCGSKIRSESHPTQKPIALMEYLVKLVSREGSTVLDPFMGSGSTGIACKKLGREFIGIELEPDYLEIAKARIEAYEVKPEQELLF